MLFLLVLGMMDGDEHGLGINLKVVGMSFNMLDLTPFLSPCTILILFFIFSLLWYCLRRCNFAFLTDLQLCISQQKSGRLRTGVKWSSGFDCCYNIYFLGEETFIKTTPRGGALHSPWHCRASQLCVSLHLLILNQNITFHAKLRFMLFFRIGLMFMRICRYFHFILPFNFQNIVRVFLLHFNLKWSRYTPLALMFTSGLSYIMPQNLLEKVILYIF